MKYLILFIFIVLSGCKSEKEKFYEETGIYLFDCDKSKPSDCYFNDWKICKSHTKKIDNNTRVIACYNTALINKMTANKLIKYYEKHDPKFLPFSLGIRNLIDEYLKFGKRTCFNTVFKNDSIKNFCKEFTKDYDNLCRHHDLFYCKNPTILIQN